MGPSSSSGGIASAAGAVESSATTAALTVRYVLYTNFLRMERVAWAATAIELEAGLGRACPDVGLRSSDAPDPDRRQPHRVDPRAHAGGRAARDGAGHQLRAADPERPLAQGRGLDARGCAAVAAAGGARAVGPARGARRGPRRR